jgi:hypothetical protein
VVVRMVGEGLAAPYFSSGTLSAAVILCLPKHAFAFRQCDNSLPASAFLQRDSLVASEFWSPSF